MREGMRRPGVLPQMAPNVLRCKWMGVSKELAPKQQDQSMQARSKAYHQHDRRDRRDWRDEQHHCGTPH